MVILRGRCVALLFFNLPIFSGGLIWNLELKFRFASNQPSTAAAAAATASKNGHLPLGQTQRRCLGDRTREVHP